MLGLLTAVASLVDHGCEAPVVAATGSRVQAQSPRGMWDLPRPGIEPGSLALQGRFLSTGPPGKPPNTIFF